VPIDRPSIQRSDFPTVRRGYEPDAVDAHLRHVADEVESMRGRGGQPVAAAASSRVQQIVEAAETTADQLRAEAGEEARDHVHRVSTAARELLERLGAMHDELGALMDRLREDAGRLSAELRSLEADVVEIAPPVEDDPIDEQLWPVEELEVEEPAAAEAMAAEAMAEEAPVEEAPAAEAPAAEGAPETAAAKARAKRAPKAKKPAKASSGGDEEDARLVALDMALAGTPRDETEKYLAEHYSLADPGAVLDDVYALAGS
jgi:DivIVA domain-containing protein